MVFLVRKWNEDFIAKRITRSRSVPPWGVAPLDWDKTKRNWGGIECHRPDSHVIFPAEILVLRPLGFKILLQMVETMSPLMKNRCVLKHLYLSGSLGSLGSISVTFAMHDSASALSCSHFQLYHSLLNDGGCTVTMFTLWLECHHGELWTVEGFAFLLWYTNFFCLLIGMNWTVTLYYNMISQLAKVMWRKGSTYELFDKEGI